MKRLLLYLIFALDNAAGLLTAICSSSPQLTDAAKAGGGRWMRVTSAESDRSGNRGQGPNADVPSI
jgi:hypothetical protein